MPDERKLVTVLFADTTGSTALGEALDPEDVRVLMGRYYAHAQRIIDEHGGTLEKFIGDAVMAVFGLPQAHSNDAERALAAALALRAAVAADADLGGRVVLRIGVNTGDVIAATSDVARGDFLVTGDAVNVSARLEQAAHPGEILASARTATAAQAGFMFEPARSVLVKGKTQPLDAFPVVSQRPTRQPERPPLVGRKQDLAQLALLRDRALDERRPHLASIVAPAGTGKTRLLEEFLARLNPRVGFRSATARCVPYGQTLTYWPLRGLLEDLLGAAFTASSVAHAFTDGGWSAEDAQRLAGLVLATLGIEGGGKGQGKRSEQAAERDLMFNAWRLLIEALAHQAPRIVIFEDLHWASESLLDLVEHIMQPRTEAALLIVATSRPELLDRRPTWGGGRRNFTALTLDPLNKAQAETLVGKLAKKMPTAIRAQIVERSGGNPFFIIELTRTMSQRGTPAGQDGSVRLLPDTVQEAVQERLDMLSALERTVLQTAAVVGRQFRPATLVSLLNLSASATVEAALEGLLARDLITPAADGTYAFRHILIRDVAYSTLARSERIRLHTAVAVWLEQFAVGRVDEFVGLIAYHYREAALLARQSAVSLTRPPDTARALYFLERAGEIASRTGAFVEAGAMLRSAIECAPAADHRRLQEALGDGLIIGDDALAAYRQALDSWRADPVPDALVGARLMRKMLVLLMRWKGSITERPTPETLRGLLSEMRQLAEQAGDEYELWRARVVELFWSFWDEDRSPEQAPAQMAVGLEAAAYFEALSDWAAFNEALDAYQGRASDYGDFPASIAASRRRLDAPSPNANERADALGVLVEALTAAGDYASAVETAQLAIVQRKTEEPATLLGHAAVWASLAACLSGRWSAIAELAQLLDEDWEERERVPGFVAITPGHFAVLRVALAREDEALIAREAATLRRLFTARRLAAYSRIWVALTEALVRDDAMLLQAATRSTTPLKYIYSNDVQLVMFLSEHGKTLPQPLFDQFIVPHPNNAERYCAHIARALADDDNTRLAHAIDEADLHGLIPHAARMRVVLAQRTGDPTRLEQARSVLEHLGDRQFLRRLEEVQGAL
jgi:class 3 adenylate cyclase